MKEQLFFVFDVESVGLHGTPFAFGFVVINRGGGELDSGLFACNPNIAAGPDSAREWVAANIPAIPETHEFPSQVQNVFWEKWLYWKEKGALLAADCAWPVEARFLIAAVDQRPKEREWEGPYPLIDIGSVIFAKGGNPLEDRTRLPVELPRHQPLADARQSARLLIEALNKA